MFDIKNYDSIESSSYFAFSDTHKHVRAPTHTLLEGRSTPTLVLAVRTCYIIVLALSFSRYS